jgi:hypothetical protein
VPRNLPGIPEGKYVHCVTSLQYVFTKETKKAIWEVKIDKSEIRQLLISPKVLLAAHQREICSAAFVEN